MEEIVTILSTREWAITIWGTGFFIWMLTQRNCDLDCTYNRITSTSI